MKKNSRSFLKRKIKIKTERLNKKLWLKRLQAKKRQAQLQKFCEAEVLEKIPKLQQQVLFPKEKKEGKNKTNAIMRLSILQIDYSTRIILKRA